jgi:hypothetical protein
MSPRTWLNSVLCRTKPVDLDGLDSPPASILSKHILYWVPRFQLTHGTVLVKLGSSKENDWMVVDEDALSRASPVLRAVFSKRWSETTGAKNRIAPESSKTLVVREYRDEPRRGHLLPHRQKSTRNLQL